MTSSNYVDVPDNHFPLNTLSIIYFWKPQAKLSSMKMMPNIISKRSKQTKVANVSNVSNVVKVVKVVKIAKVSKVSDVAKVAKVAADANVAELESVASSAATSISIKTTEKNNNTELSTDELWLVIILVSGRKS